MMRYQSGRFSLAHYRKNYPLKARRAAFRPPPPSGVRHQSAITYGHLRDLLPRDIPQSCLSSSSAENSAHQGNMRIVPIARYSCGADLFRLEAAYVRCQGGDE